MIQEAINTLSNLLDKFPQAVKIEVVTSKNIILTHEKKGATMKTPYEKKEFSSAIEMLEYLEKNLEEKTN